MAGWGVVADGGAECKVQMGEVVEVRVVQVDMGECAGFWGEGGTGGWGGGRSARVLTIQSPDGPRGEMMQGQQRH